MIWVGLNWFALGFWLSFDPDVYVSTIINVNAVVFRIVKRKLKSSALNERNECLKCTRV